MYTHAFKALFLFVISLFIVACGSTISVEDEKKLKRLTLFIRGITNN